MTEPLVLFPVLVGWAVSLVVAGWYGYDLGYDKGYAYGQLNKLWELRGDEILEELEDNNE